MEVASYQANECLEALSPGELCHPDRFNGTMAGKQPIGSLGFLQIAPTKRRFCPYVMPCEPPVACGYNNSCTTGYVSKYDAYAEGALGMFVCNPRHFTLPSGQCYAPRCSMCDVSEESPHFRLNGVCVPCPSIPWLLPAAMIFVCLCVAVGMFFLNRSGINMSILSVGVDYFQTLSVIMKLFVPLPPGVELPFDISIVIGWMQWFQLDLDMTGPECALRGFLTYERKWWVKVSFPLLGGILVAVFVIIIYVKRTLTKCQIWLADRKRRRPRKKKQISNEAPLSAVVISMTFAMIYFLYLTICRTALEIFNCADTEPKTGRYYMVSEPMEECFVIGALQDRLAPYALMVLAGYTGGYPMLLLCIFHYYKDKIIADQVMRAHDRGETPRTNRFFFLRIAFGKVYYMFRPKHYRWGLTVLARKFLLSVIFLLFNDDVTFQVASILGVVFVNFVLQVRFMPYMGTREKAVVIRGEAEERILTEIKRLERAQLLVKINGKSYYELMHKMRVEIDEQEEIMNKHKHDLFNLNTVETTLLGALVFLCLCAVMTNSKYVFLFEPSFNHRPSFHESNLFLSTTDI